MMLLKDKLKIARQRINDLELIIAQYARSESGHLVAANYGNGVSEDTNLQDVQDAVLDLNNEELINKISKD
jgi:hypothetical protein